MRHIIYHILIISVFLLSTMPLHAENKGEKINATEIVLSHIKDSHEWHITGEGENAIVIHLPIIVRSSTGWHVFSSKRFAEEPDAQGMRQGPYNLAIGEGELHNSEIVEMIDTKYHSVFDISITKTVANLLIDALILIFIIIYTTRWYRKHQHTDPAPSGLTGLIEMLVSYLQEDIIKPCVGEGYEKYCPYLFSAFFFIFVCNLMGLIPFGGNVTGNIAITFFLALCTFIITQFSGNKHYWKDIFNPNVPGPVKPFALMIRLFANMLAGHAIALALTCIIFIVGSTMSASWLYGLGTFSIILSICMMLLELLVCFLQALVFTMLSATFIGIARSEPEYE